MTHPTDQYPTPDQSLPVVSLPPLLALTTMKILLCSDEPFARLAYILSSIHTALALVSVTLTSQKSPPTGTGPQVRGLMWISGWRGWLCRLRLREV